jgi:glycosyltransferase involved in cell wall biosynthesis
MTGNNAKLVVMIGYINYPTDNRVRREAEALAATGNYRIRVLTPSNSYLNSQRYAKNGVKIVELSTGKYRGKSKIRYLQSYLIFMLKTFLHCARMPHKIDVVHVHNMPDFLVFSAIIPRLLGKKIILDIHDTMAETYLAKFQKNTSKFILWLLRMEEKLSCMFATDIICVNHPQKQLLIERGIPESKITVTMNVPDPAVFKPENGPNRIDVPHEGVRLVYHGTVTRRLGIDLVIKAIPKVKNKLPGICFYVFGDGDDIDEFIELSKELEVEKLVIFNRKFTPMEELIPTLKTMDIGIVSNRWNVAADQMLPVKMLEYVILDKPVIAPRLKTIEHYFGSDMISFFKPDDVDSLADAIILLAQDETRKRNQAENARTFLQKFGWEEHKKDFIAMYDR